MGEPATIVSAASAALGVIQNQAQARAQARAQAAAANREIEQQRLQQQLREKQRREESKAEQARARASFAARGVSSAGGSAHALVEGIAVRTEDAIDDDRRLLDFGIETLRRNQRAQQRQNLLSARNSILNTVVGTGGKILRASGGGSFGSGNHPGER